MGKFVGNLVVKLIKDEKDVIWELVEPFSYRSNCGKIYIVPVGFQTDFMSVPRIPLIYEELGNRGRMSGTIHDWLYSTHAEDRKICDKLLMEMLMADDFNFEDAEACYLAVRLGGESHW